MSIEKKKTTFHKKSIDFGFSFFRRDYSGSSKTSSKNFENACLSEHLKQAWTAEGEAKVPTSATPSFAQRRTINAPSVYPVCAYEDAQPLPFFLKMINERPKLYLNIAVFSKN